MVKHALKKSKGANISGQRVYDFAEVVMRMRECKKSFT
jgi:hypothetical protein